MNSGRHSVSGQFMTLAVAAATLVLAASAFANPANKLALKRRFGEFLPATLNDFRLVISRAAIILRKA